SPSTRAGLFREPVEPVRSLGHMLTARERQIIETALSAHATAPTLQQGESCTHPRSHFTAENAAGASNWLLMFSTNWPSFSVLATTAIHSGSARKAPQRFSRSARLSQASMYVISWLLVPISVVQNPTWRMPCFSQIRSVSFSKRDSSAGLRPGTQR